MKKILIGLKMTINYPSLAKWSRFTEKITENSI